MYAVYGIKPKNLNYKLHLFVSNAYALIQQHIYIIKYLANQGHHHFLIQNFHCCYQCQMFLANLFQ